MPLDIDRILFDVKNEIGADTEEHDSDTDSRLTRYIKSGAALLEKTAGCSVDFEADELAAALLVDYCRYANSQMTEFFEENYSVQLAALNADYTVRAYRMKGGDEGAES